MPNEKDWSPKDVQCLQNLLQNNNSDDCNEFESRVLVCFKLHKISDLHNFILSKANLTEYIMLFQVCIGTTAINAYE